MRSVWPCGLTERRRAPCVEPKCRTVLGGEMALRLSSSSGSKIKYVVLFYSMIEKSKCVKGTRHLW